MQQLKTVDIYYPTQSLRVRRPREAELAGSGSGSVLSWLWDHSHRQAQSRGSASLLMGRSLAEASVSLCVPPAPSRMAHDRAAGVPWSS